MMGHFQSTTPKVSEEDIQKEVKSSPVVVFTKTHCSYCEKAKQLLDKERIQYKENNLDTYQRLYPENHQPYINQLMYVTKQTSVPQIFICGKFIGGFTELMQLKKSGKLLEAIAECSSPPQKSRR